MGVGFVATPDLGLLYDKPNAREGTDGRPEAPVGVNIHPPKERDDVKPETLLKRQNDRGKYLR